MARPLRAEFEGAVHHATVRGNAREGIFNDDLDREHFLAHLAEGAATHGIRLYLFCLMRNHVHLVLETPRANLGRFMQGLLTSHAVYFNLRHGRVGHLTQGRYGARLVDADEYLLRLSRYVHLNPVVTGAAGVAPLEERIAALRAYPWSSYRSYIGLARHAEFVEYGPVLEQMGGDTAARPNVYREFVETGLAQTDEEFAAVLKASPRCIGGETFRAWVDGLHAALLCGRKSEDVSHRRPAGRRAPDEVLDAVCRGLSVPQEELCRATRGTWLRPIAAYALSKYAGMTQRDASRKLGLGTGAAVSAALRKLRTRLPADKKLRETLARVEGVLAGKAK